MTAKKKILFAAFEAAPFIKTGGLGDVAGSLPENINNDEFECRVILPKLKQIPQNFQDEMQFAGSYFVPLGWRNQYVGIFTFERRGVKYYFLDNEYYFHRDRVYGEFDDAERTAFFSKAVLETIIHLDDFKPDVIHCNDWHTAMIPVFLREQYMLMDDFARIKVVFTIHNLKFQGQYDPNIIGDVLGLENTPAARQMVYEGAANYLRTAVIYSDMVTTVSPTYAENICTPEYGEGLDGLFRDNSYKLRGIINGISYLIYNPEEDKDLVANFSPTNYNASENKKKKANKKALQKDLGLEVNGSIPLFAVVSRLTPQKGMDLVTALIDNFGNKNMQLAVLGTGDDEYEWLLKEAEARYPGKIATRIEFSDGLSKRFYASADCFIMPSAFEPCGLAQMMAMHYATLPIVRETGGLKDTVKGYADYGNDANGFVFKDADMNGLDWAVNEAIDLYENHKPTWAKLQKNAATEDFSWRKPAEQYRALYSELIG